MRLTKEKKKHILYIMTATGIVMIALVTYLVIIIPLEPLSYRYSSSDEYRQDLLQKMNSNHLGNEARCALFLSQCVLDEPLGVDLNEIIDTGNTIAVGFFEWNAKQQIGLGGNYIVPEDIELIEKNGTIIKFKLKSSIFVKLDKENKCRYYGQYYPYGPPFYYDTISNRVIVYNNRDVRLPSWLKEQAWDILQIIQDTVY